MSKKNESRRKALLRKLTNRYRLVLLNEETFEERGSMRLTRLNLIAASGIVLILLVAVAAAAAALEYATGVKLGHDPDAWRSWWKARSSLRTATVYGL